MGSIVVLGSANMDLVVRQPRQPDPGETIFGTQFSMGAGGKGLNQAVAAARSGGIVRMIAAIGEDDFGSQLVGRMEYEGIDISHVKRCAVATGVAQITVTEDGENSIVVVPGANASEEFHDGDRAAIAGASYLVVQLERPMNLLLEAMSYARSKNVTTVLTPAPVRDGTADLIGLADIVVLNEGEAIALAGTADASSAAEALSLVAGTVIVTLGSRGADVAQNGKIVFHAQPRSVSPVDTTAAGDTFVGALVAQLANGAVLTEALGSATIAASITVTREGAVDSIPTLSEIINAS